MSLSLAVDEFLGKLLFSFIVGGACIVAVTIAAERFSMKVVE